MQNINWFWFNISTGWNILIETFEDGKPSWNRRLHDKYQDYHVLMNFRTWSWEDIIPRGYGIFQFNFE